MRRLLLALPLMLLLGATAYGQTNCTGLATCNLTATDMASPAAFAAALNTVNQDPATVNVPAGSFTWTSGNVVVTFTRSITIKGAGAQFANTNGAGATGTDATTILDHVPGSGTPITFTTTAGKSFRITGIFFKTDSGSSAHSDGMLVFQGDSTSARIDHMHILTQGGFVGIGMAGVIGVADHNFMDCGGPGSFNCLNNHYAFHNYGAGGWGDVSWTQPDNWGSSQFMFVEDNYFHNGGLLDAAFGGRYVVRHSTCIADPYNSQFVSPFPNPPVGVCQLYSHGLTPGNQRSMRAAEIYLNNIQQPTTYIGGAPNTTDLNQAGFSMNGGTELNWGNTVNLLRELMSVDYTRKADNPPNYTYAAPPTGWGHCTGTGTFTGWDNPSGYPCLDGVGRGAGDRLGGNLPSRCNLTTNPGCTIFTGQQAHQALSPVYVWNNTFNNHATFGTPSLVAIQAAQIVNNRDIYMQFGQNGNSGTFNGTVGIGQGSVAPTTAGAYSGAPNCTAGPGGNTPGVGWWNTSNNTLYVCNPTNTWTVYYTPFVYPHPLASGGGGVVPPPPPNVPTSLTGTVSASTVSLSWTASSGSPVPTAYTLYRGSVHGGPYSIVKSGLTSISTTDTPPNGTWFYVVAAYVGGIVTNIVGSGSVATVTCTTTCAFPSTAIVAVGGNSVSGFNGTFTSTGQPNASSFTFASSTGGTGTGGGAWQTASESAKSNEIQVTVPAALTATLLPASRTFGSFTVGTSSPSQAFTWTNTSGAGGNVTISAEGFGGANPGDFSQTNTCGALPVVKAPGSTCTFNITFTPTAAGARAATFFVTDNATGSPHTVSMSGTGVSAAPLVNLNPTSLNFGDQTLSTTSTTRSIILTNTGSGTLTITSVVASGDFAVTTVPVTNCGGSLAPLATCSLNVTFTPTATGGRTGSVTVTDNAAGNPHVATLSGNGITTKCQMTGNVTLSGPGSVCQ